MYTLRIFLIIILLFSSTSFIYGQATNNKIVVYFGVNKYDFKQEQLKTIDALNSITGTTEKIKIILKGYTDSDADSIYNLTLSKNRVNTVRDKLSAKYSHIDTYYYGEQNPVSANTSKDGKSKNRRVEVEIIYEDDQLVPSETVKIKREIVDTCARDTLIYLPGGSNFSINICDYTKYKHCLKVNEYLTYNAILKSNLTTLTTANELLSTDGMIAINICNYGTRLVHPLIFKVPVGSNRFNDGLAKCDVDTNYKRMTLWSSSADNKWGNDTEVKVVKLNDTLFYEFAVAGSGGYNFDYKINTKNLKNVKTKIKAKGVFKLVTVRVLTTSPSIIVEPKTIINNRAKLL